MASYYSVLLTMLASPTDGRSNLMDHSLETGLKYLGFHRFCVRSEAAALHLSQMNEGNEP